MASGKLRFIEPLLTLPSSTKFGVSFRTRFIPIFTLHRSSLSRGPKSFNAFISFSRNVQYELSLLQPDLSVLCVQHHGKHHQALMHLSTLQVDFV